MTSYRKIVTSLSFFKFLANLEQSGGRIPDTESAKVMFSVTVTICLTKTENRTKNVQHSSHTIALSKGTFQDKKHFFCKKNADINKIKGAQSLKGIFSKTMYGCVLTCQIKPLKSPFRLGLIRYALLVKNWWEVTTLFKEAAI